MKRRVGHWVRRLREERGQVLVLFALGLAGFLGIVGLSIDIGHVAYTRSALQNAADAAALAGAQSLDGTAAGKTAAEAVALSYAQKNGVSNCAVGSCIVVTASGGNGVYDTITVTPSRNVPYYFLKFVGMSSANPSRTAAAKATPLTITGYSWASVAPFVIWGGSRQSEVHAGDAHCPLHTCVGSSYTFLDTGWMNASGSPTAPDWTANGSNNFKGDLNHGDGAPVNEVGDTFSAGGLGSVTAPDVGSLIVLPIVDRASGNSNMRTFRIAAWAIVKVDAGCRKQGCTGTIQDTSVTPPPGYDSNGSSQPPSSLSYKYWTFHLTQ